MRKLKELLEREKKTYIDVKVKDNILKVKLVNADKGQRHFQLYGRENKRLNTTNIIKKNQCEFYLEEEGCYYIKETVSGLKSEWIDYYNASTRKSFEEFCNKNEIRKLEADLNLNIYKKMEEPYKDFAVCLSNCGKSVSSSFLKKYDLKKDMWSKNVEIISAELREQASKKFAFSGMMKKDGVFICGEKDIKESVELDSDYLGNYTYVSVNEDKVEIGNDYFGIGKLYYYESSKDCIISNRYELLLLLMKDIGIQGELDACLVEALLCKQNQPFQQTFMRQREIKETYMLPMDEKIIITSKGWEKCKKSIASVFEGNNEGIDEEYLEELLEEGIKEISENVEIILKDKRFDKVILDLTGGLDSRVVYGLVNKFPEFHDKILLNLIGTKKEFNTEKSDVEIACKLNSVTHYDYLENYVEYNKTMTNLSNWVLNGYYYDLEYVMKRDIKARESFIKLNGFFGEICQRAYYTRTLLEKKINVDSISELISVAVNREGILSGKCYNRLQEKLEKELAMLPGNTPLEVWELQYLFYRNRLHCGEIWFCEEGILSWGPLQSKSLFKYKHLVYGRKDSLEEQLKIIDAIDKRMILTCFDKEKNEAARLKYINDKYNADWLYEFELVRKEQEKISNLMKKSWYFNYDQEVSKISVQYAHKLDEMINEMLLFLMNCNKGITKELGLAIYWTIKNNKYSDKEKMVLYWKLYSLFVQIKIFSV